MTLLDLKEGRPPSSPKDAATVILVRERSGELEVFSVERHSKSGFLGGAVVFPGGKVDDVDRDRKWEVLADGPSPRALQFAADASGARAFAVAACRETLEEAALLLARSRQGDVGRELTNDRVLALRRDCASDAAALERFLREQDLMLDTTALAPFSRWITPLAEGRRFDARFFLARAPEGQEGSHDSHETVSSFWAAPQAVIARFLAGEIQLAPPTHATLAVLAEHASIDRIFRYAETACLDPICPLLVPVKEVSGDTVALALPGDPEHEVRQARAPGPSRYVLRESKWVPEEAS